MSKVSRGREETPCVRCQGWPGEATSHLKPRVVTLRSHPKPEAKGGSWEEPSMPEARAGGREELPHVQGAVTARAQEGLEELSHVQGKEGQGEEIPLVQGKEQWLHFAGAAMKRYSTPKVRETQVRW